MKRQHQTDSAGSSSGSDTLKLVSVVDFDEFDIKSRDYSVQSIRFLLRIIPSSGTAMKTVWLSCRVWVEKDP